MNHVKLLSNHSISVQVSMIAIHILLFIQNESSIHCKGIVFAFLMSLNCLACNFCKVCLSRSLSFEIVHVHVVESTMAASLEYGAYEHIIASLLALCFHTANTRAHG